MRFSLPILLLTATAALAQPAPDKPFVYDSAAPPLKGFVPPTPVTVISPDGKTVLHEPAPANAVTEKPAKIELRPVMPDFQKPEPPKQAPKGFG